MKQTLRYKTAYTLSYTEFGDKSGWPILINHGLIASITDSNLFERLIWLGARLICIARPGYGESSPYELYNIGEWGDIVSVLVDELQLSHFDVLGMSSGAPYSYALGWKFPDRVRNIFIFSGIPALYDDKVLSYWPWELDKHASMAGMKKLAHDLFFANLTAQDMENEDVRDSMMNDGFGIAQDFKIRCVDWGFRLVDVKQAVWMQHSRADNFMTAELTAKLLPNCTLDRRESNAHFSSELLDDFIRTTMARWYEK